MLMPWDENRWCEWTPRNVRRQRAEEEPAAAGEERVTREKVVAEPPQRDLIAVIVRALGPFEEARRAVAEAIRVYGGIALCSD
jgi:hypothetical protein